MAVADVFTALTEDRPYRLGMDFDKTRDVLRDIWSQVTNLMGRL